MEDTERAMNQAMYYLGTRARTARQMEDYLTQKGYDEHCIARVMEKLIDYGLLDDRQYARRFVQTHKDSCGSYMLRQKLRQKGLSAEDIDSAVGEISFEEQVSAALSLLERKTAGDEREDALARAVQSALRHGFSYEAVHAAADQYKEGLEWQE